MGFLCIFPLFFQNEKKTQKSKGKKISGFDCYSSLPYALRVIACTNSTFSSSSSPSATRGWSRFSPASPPRVLYLASRYRFLAKTFWTRISSPRATRSSLCCKVRKVMELISDAFWQTSDFTHFDIWESVLTWSLGLLTWPLRLCLDPISDTRSRPHLIRDSVLTGFLIYFHFSVRSGNQKHELDRTETIQDNLNPVFEKKIMVDYFFEERQVGERIGWPIGEEAIVTADWVCKLMINSVCYDCESRMWL